MGYLQINYKKTLEIQQFIDNFYEDQHINIKQVLAKIEDTAEVSEVLNFYNIDSFDFTSSGGLWEVISKNNIPSNIWRGIYKHSDQYFHVDGYNYTHPTDTNIKAVLDFGIACSPLGVTSDEIEYYFVELNTAMWKYNKEKYQDHKNVHVIQNLSEIPDNVRFDYVQANDSLEHVKYINEHLYVLYYYGNTDCLYNLRIDEHPGGAHILNISKDTKIDSVWISLK